MMTRMNMKTKACLAAGAVFAAALLARPAAAQWAGPPAAAAPTREQQEQWFAQQSLRRDGSRVMRGPYRVYPSTLYSLVGRADLNEALRTRALTKEIVVASGGLVLAAGLAWGLVVAARETSPCNSPYPPPNCSNTRTNFGPFPWLVAGLGGTAMIVGLLLPTDPVSTEEKDQLIRDYNQRLRAGTTLAGAVEAARRTARVSASLPLDGSSGLLVAGFSF